MSNMDYIDIQVYTSASKANAELDKLIIKLDAVQSSLSSIGGKSVNFGTQIKSQSNTATAGLNKVSASMNKTAHSTNVLSKAFGTFYANYFWVVRGIKGLWNSIENTADYMESYQYLNVAFNKIAKDWSGDFKKYGRENAEAYAKSFTDRMNEVFSKLSGIEFDNENMRLASNNVKNLGLNIREITQYAAQLGSVTNSVGLSGESSMAASTMFTQLAGDLSSLYNVDYSSVAKNLQSGLIGQSRALYKYGIDITNATLQTKAYELGLEKAVSEMTQAEKMQLRMLVILDQSRVAWGNLANEIDQPSNQIRLFKNNLSELSQMLGQLFIPLLSKVMPVVNGITIAIKNLLSTIAGIFNIKLDFNSLKPNEIEEGYDGVSDSLDNVADSAKNAKSHLLGIDELNVVEPQTESGGASGGVSGGIDLTDEILKATEEYQKIWDEAYAQMENRAQAFADQLSVVLKPIEQLFRDIKIGDWFAVGENTSNIVSGIFNLFSNALANVDWYQIGHNMGLFLAGIDWTGIFSSLGRFIWEGISSSIEMWVGSFNIAPFETAFLTILALPGIVGFGSKLVEFIASPFKNAFDLLPISNQIAEMFALWSGGAGTLGESFMAVFGTGGVITVALAGLAVGLKWVYDKNEEVRTSFEQATESVSQGFKPLLEVITNNIIPYLKSGWYFLMETLSPFTEFLEGTFVSIWQDMINPALTYLGETILPLLTTSLDMLWNDIFVPLEEFLSSFFMPIIEWLSAGLTVLWENIVVPLANALGNILGKAFEGIVGIINVLVIPIIDAVIDIFQILWTEILEPVATWLVDTFGPVFETVFGIIGNLIDDLSQTFGGLLDFIFGVFTLDWEKAWNGVKDIFKGIFNGLISIVEGVANLIIGGLNILLSGINGITNAVGDVIGVDISIPYIANIYIPRYATGGFPEDGLFFANHTELVGKFENGKTAVANNMQIIDGIKYGVREAVSETLAPYLADIAESNREVANKDLSVNIGDREIARANRRGQKSLGYQLITE